MCRDLPRRREPVVRLHYTQVGRRHREDTRTRPTSYNRRKKYHRNSLVLNLKVPSLEILTRVVTVVRTLGYRLSVASGPGPSDRRVGPVASESETSRLQTTRELYPVCATTLPLLPLGTGTRPERRGVEEGVDVLLPSSMERQKNSRHICHTYCIVSHRGVSKAKDLKVKIGASILLSHKSVRDRVPTGRVPLPV